MGDHIRRPLDEYVSRLVQSWQTSQPLHIRHLSIVRDTVLKGKSQVYIYYTYENFKRLVEGGTGFWEAVTPISSQKTIGKNVAASLNAKPDVDEYGFPKLDENQFQGRHNDATLEECVSALGVDPLHISANDPVIKKQADGSYCEQHNGSLRFVSIDFDLGLWYKSQQQRPRSTSKKAASTPSQPAPIRTGAKGSDKRALLTPSVALITKSHVIGPEKVTESKTPSVVPAEGRVIGSQIQRRKLVRRPDSKPLGRPRKYPKTGIPANFDTMTPDEVDYLFRSQEMFEKYEIVKVEKEIVRRIEEGEDAVTVAYEVLAQCEKSRKQEGEMPLPKISRAQVLHNFAGEPLPEPDPGEAKPKGRHRKDTWYWPSMAAHTYSVPALRKRKFPEPKSKDPEKGPPILPARTRARGRGALGLESKTYLPSRAAHSWRYVRPPTSVMEMSTTDILDNSTKRKQGRPAKAKQLPGPYSKYLPSIAAYSGLCLPFNTLSIAKAGQKRKRTANTLLENDGDYTTLLGLQYLPSVAAHSGSSLPSDVLHVAGAGPKRRRIEHMLLGEEENFTTPSTSTTATREPRIMPAREALLGTSNVQLNAGNEGMYPGWEKFMSKHYQQHLATIPRSNAGVYIGKTTPRRKRPCEPRDFRPTHFKLAVIKTTRLNELDLFVKKTIDSEQMSPLESRAQTPTSQVVERALVPITQSPSQGQPDPLTTILLPSPAPSHSRSQRNASYNSPYADIAGTKRKRTTSPQPTRGAAPVDPFSASPYSRQSTPTVESFKLISKPSTLSEKVALSPAIDHVHGNAIIENGTPTRTPERQPDKQVLCEPTSNAPVSNDSDPMQSEIATDQVVQSSQPPTQNPSKPSNKQSISRISRREGSTAMLRKNIIMEILDKCGGVFPSHREMSSPFAAEWKRRGQEGTPELKTISNAVNALIKEHKLRQITFTAQTKQGIVVTKSMLISPTIDTTDPRIKEIQTKMVAYHPRYFVPMAVLPPQDYQSAGISEHRLNSEEASDKMAEGIVHESSALEAPQLRRLDLARKIMDGKEKAAIARLKALKERDQQGPGHAHGDEPAAKTIKKRATKDAAPTASQPALEILPKATPKRSSGTKGHKRVERLASIKRAIPSLMTPLPTGPLKPISDSVPLTWLPPNYAFSDFNFEEQRPTVLMAGVKSNLQIVTPEAPVSLDSNNKARQRIPEMAKIAAPIQRKQAMANPTKSSLLPTDPNPDQFGSPYASVPPTSPRQASTYRIVTSNTARPRNRPIPYAPLHADEAILGMTVRSEDNLGLGNVSLEGIRPMPPASRPPRRESLNTAASPPPESSLSCVPRRAVVSHAEDLRRWSQRALLVSFMDPIHYFHRATGTFSVTFSGLRPPQKICAHRGTALDPYAASPKAVQPYSSYRRSPWPSALQESHKTNKTPFNEEVDNVLRRELEENERNDVALMGWPFVNHVFSHAHQTVQVAEADMQTAKQVRVRHEDGRLMTRRFPRDNESRQRTGNSIVATGSRGIDRVIAESRIPLKRRRLTSAVELGTQDEISKKVDSDHEHRPTKFHRVRGPRQAKSLGENGEERLLTAVMVIRALTGGLDKRIDWVLVAKVFEPTYSQMFVHSRWSLTLQKYKLVLPKMESDFQSIFASAYEEGTVPALDYDNLENYDWKWLVEWTMANVDRPTQSLPELPVERSEFDALFTLNETSNTEINEFYEIDGSSVLARRTKIMHRDPYVLPLVQGPQRACPGDAEDLKTAKSWIRANIMTPESTYNPSAARAKLSTFPDRTVEDALKQLLLDRVLTQANKGRLVPGRNYDISDFLLSRLKKNLQSAHFHRAAAYKQQIDHDFKEKGFAHYSNAADDGDMIVIVNLQAHQRITVMPIDVPMNKWGQTDGGYETRQMDKRRLNFRLELRPSPTYIFGDPLSPLPPPPCQHLQDPMARIPLWYDIHNSLVPVMWEMALAAVVAVLAVRPGIGATELEKVMRPALEVWELQMILEWLIGAKAAKPVDQGFSVEDEWWWLALGTGKNSENRSSEDFGDGKGRTKAEGKGKRKERAKEGAQDDFSMEVD